MNGLVLVTTRNRELELPELGMRCDQREMVFPTDGEGFELFIGIATVVGKATPQSAPGDGEAQPIDTAGMLAMAIAATRMYGIVAPEEANEPAVWFAADRGTFSATGVGSEGLFRKRPRAVQIAGPEWELTLAQIGKISGPAADRFVAGQADALLAAL